jgi:CHAT domain-containing protein/tetratricopeptide (TPR) repeat protein
MIRERWLLCGSLLSCWCLAAALMQAQTFNQGTPARLQRQAEERYRADDLQGAVRLCRQVLAGPDLVERRRASELLITIYARLGRQDMAVQVGNLYAQMLKAPGDAPLRRDLRLKMGECLFTLGHWGACQSELEMALADGGRWEPLPASRYLTALLHLARASENLGDKDKSARYRLQLEELALSRLQSPRPPLQPQQRVECVWRLDDSFTHFEDPKGGAATGVALAVSPTNLWLVGWTAGNIVQAEKKQRERIEWLESLLPIHDALRDVRDKCETLRRLAVHHTALGDHNSAERRLEEALEILNKNKISSSLLQGDLKSALAEVLRANNQAEKADRLQEEAVADYLYELTAPRNGAQAAAPLAAFWKLQQHYQNTTQFGLALKLAEDHAEEWGQLLEPRMKSERGGLKLFLNSYPDARKLLEEAIDDLEKQDPPNLVELPRVLNNLAIVEVETNPKRALELVTQCMKLYGDLPPDLNQVETHNLFGTCKALQGDYTEGIKEFQTALDLCDKLGSLADRQRSKLLLNKALLYKAQYELDEALLACHQAWDAFRKVVKEPDTLEDGGFAAALASIHATKGTQRDVDEAFKQVDTILKVCGKHKLKDGPLWMTALHCQALNFLLKKKYDLAEIKWNEILLLLQEAKVKETNAAHLASALGQAGGLRNPWHGGWLAATMIKPEKEKETQTLLEMRTLNYLGLAAEVSGHPDKAEKLYRRAYAALLKKDDLAFPITRFTTCWRLANMLDRKNREGGQTDEARRMLEKAVDGVEKARQSSFVGGGQGRANYYSQFTPGFEDLIDWSVRDKHLEIAFDTLVRSRSRVLLDQLQSPREDPLAALQGVRGEELRQQAKKIRQELYALEVKIRSIPKALREVDATAKLHKEWYEKQEEYRKVWRDVMLENQFYAKLATEIPANKTLEFLRKKLSPNTVLLVYYVGREKSYLFVNHGDDLKAFELKVPKDVARAVPSQLAMNGAFPHPSVRGFDIEFVPEIGPEPPPKASPPPPPHGPLDVALNESVAQAIVEMYRKKIQKEGSQFGEFRRDLEFIPNKPGEHAPAAQSLELAADVLLPAEVRKYIRDVHADKLLVVPDGPLHKLPLEALVVKAEDGKIRYLLDDDLPPITYAPSLAILGLLTDRPAPRGPLSLLTVCNPVYPKGLGVSRLPGTLKESNRVCKLFNEKNVDPTVLKDETATKANVKVAVKGKRVILLAAHGYAHETFGDLWGAIVLSPPPDKDRLDEDSFLSLGEIYMLPLEDCELAVLSACATNVGPQRPLEAGVTVASGFLAAGARRVVASHWKVNDESTAELMEAFFKEYFKEMTAAAQKGEPISHARALHKAQQHLRQIDKWSSPYYWAPFVLLGPEN